MFIPLKIVLLCALLVIAPLTFVVALFSGAGFLGALGASFMGALQYVFICLLVSIAMTGISLVYEKFYEPVAA